MDITGQKCPACDKKIYVDFDKSSFICKYCRNKINIIDVHKLKRSEYANKTKSGYIKVIKYYEQVAQIYKAGEYLIPRFIYK